MISRSEFIDTALELFDRSKELDDMAEELSMQIEAGIGSEPKREPDEEDTILIRLGRAKLYEDCMCSWRDSCHASYNEDGQLCVTSYKDWVESKIYKVPDYLSRDQLVAILGPKLHEEYERERDKAVAKARAEAEADE